MPSLVKPIPLERIADMPTKRLISYLDKLRACEENAECSDIGSILTDPDKPDHITYVVEDTDVEREVDTATIRFKDDPRWTRLYEAVKAELKCREHVD